MDTTRHTRPDHDDDPQGALLDAAIDAARADVPSAEEIRDAGERSWARIGAALEAEPAPLTDADYAALVPDYLAGRLPAGKTMLMADRIAADPALRRAVEAARVSSTDSVASSARTPGRAPIRLPRIPARAFAAAAAVVIAAGGWLFGRDYLQPDRVLAHVETVDGALYRIDDGTALQDGAAIRPRERLLASREGGAVITLSDGSAIELAPRSEISLASRWNGQAIRLNRGNIIVQAAPQRDGRLFVTTDECTVSVTGTIFSVRHGTKGSRVAVLEGEVRVDQAGERTVLRPGQQVSTNPSLSPNSMQDEIAWSRDQERWLRILQELRAVGEEIDATVELPAPRTASALLDAVPADTAVFVSVPNLSESLGQSYTIFRQRVAESAELSEWWAENFEASGQAERLDWLVERLGAAGDALGDELVFALAFNPDTGAGYATDSDAEPGEWAAPDSEGMAVAVAEVVDAAAFRSAVEAGLADLDAELEGEPTPIEWIDDPVAALAARSASIADDGATAGGGDADGDSPSGPTGETADDPASAAATRARLADDDALHLWLDDGLLVASPSLAALAELAGGDTGLDADFRARVEDAYDSGVDWVFALDIGRIEPLQAAVTADGDPDLLGISEAQHLVVTEVTRDGRSQLEAGLSYRERRVGAAAWLGEPAALSGLEFISPGAHAATAVILEQPEQIVESLFGFLTTVEPDAALDPELRVGQDLLSGVAAALGGQVAFALDGPLLPRPSWRAALEVYDAEALQAAIERIVETMNAKALEAHPELDPSAPPLRLESGRIGDRPSWSITLDADLDELEFRPTVHYTFADGYLVAAPSAALVDAAIRQRDSGVNLGTSADFVGALPVGSEIDFSAIAWQNLGPLAAEAERLAPATTDEEASGTGTGAGSTAGTELGAAIGSSLDLAGSLGPSLFYAWVEPDAIRFAGTAEERPFGLGMLMGLGELGHLSDQPAR